MTTERTNTIMAPRQTLVLALAAAAAALVGTATRKPDAEPAIRTMRRIPGTRGRTLRWLLPTARGAQCEVCDRPLMVAPGQVVRFHGACRRQRTRKGRR